MVVRIVVVGVAVVVVVVVSRHNGTTISVCLHGGRTPIHSLIQSAPHDCCWRRGGPRSHSLIPHPLPGWCYTLGVSRSSWCLPSFLPSLVCEMSNKECDGNAVRSGTHFGFPGDECMDKLCVDAETEREKVKLI